MRVTTDVYVKDYFDGLKSDYPLFIKYLDFINTVAGYIINMHLDLSTGYEVLESDKYQCRIDRYATIELASKILGSISKDYQDLFFQELKRGSIKFSGFKKTITSTTKKRNRIKIKIYETHTLEDVLKLVHEMLHFIHLKNSECKIDDEDFYFYSEMYAIVGDFYGAFYLLENNILKEDVLTYLKDVFISIIDKADSCICNGMFLFTYNSVGNIKDELVKKYVQAKGFPSVYEDLDFVLSSMNSFTFHEDGQYLFALPFAYVISKMMLSDDKYKDIFVNALMHTKENGSFPIIGYFGLENVLKEEESLYKIMLDFYSIIEEVYAKDNVNYQKKIGEIW